MGPAGVGAASVSDTSDAAAAAKEATGRRAADYVTDGMRVGLGHRLDGALHHRGPGRAATPTSPARRRRRQTHELATSLGLRVVAPDEIGHLDMAIDGADEVDPDFNLTKGRGGAQTREKIVAQMSDRFIVVVDESKLVDQLGPFGTPLEVLDFAPGVVAARVQALGATEVTTREVRSDNGNLLMDAQFGLDRGSARAGRGAGRHPRPGRARPVRRRAGRAVVVAGPAGVRELTRLDWICPGTGLGRRRLPC